MRDVVLLIGGPCGGHGFLAEEWQAILAAAAYRAEHGQLRSVWLDYVKGAKKDLPRRLPSVLDGDLVTPWVWKEPTR